MDFKYCHHEAAIDTGVGLIHCPMCDNAFSYEEWRVHNLSIEDRKEEFLLNLKKLLKKYHAEICIENKCTVNDYYPDYKIVVDFDFLIPSSYGQLEIGTYLNAE